MARPGCSGALGRLHSQQIRLFSFPLGFLIPYDSL